MTGTDRLAASLLAIAVWALYLMSAPRGVVLEDDGLFVLTGVHLGIQHPPGYPLFVLLAKLATLWPLGSPAWRVHALTGLFAALACAVLFLCARTLGLSRSASLLGALGLALSQRFWSQAIIADVYSLHALLFLLLLWLGIRATRTPQGAHAPAIRPCWASFLFGLGLSNHWPLLLLSAPGLALLWWPARSAVLRRLPLLLLCAAVGLAPYAWMVWRSQQLPEVSFLGPITSWRELWDYLLRTSYADVDHSATAGLADRLAFLGFTLTEASRQLLLPGALLALLGAAWQWRAWGARVAGALALAFAGPTLLLVTLLSFDFDRLRQEILAVYLLPAWAVLALWAGLGLDAVMGALSARWQPRAGRLASIAATTLLLASLVAMNWPRNDRSGDWLAQAYATALLADLPPKALLLLRGDVNTFPTAYLNRVEDVRADVRLVSEGGLILEPRLFDARRTTAAEQTAAIDDLLRSAQRPVFRAMQQHGPAVRCGWLSCELRAGSTETPAFLMRPAERALLERLLAHGAFRDGWNESLRRLLLELYARFAAQAQLSGAGSAADDAWLARQRDAVLALPEAALMRAEVLARADYRAYRQEVSALLARFAEHADDAWITKRHLARYLNLNAQAADAAGDYANARQMLLRSLGLWAGPKNPAHAVLAHYDHRGLGR